MNKEIELTEFDTTDEDVMRDIIYDKLIDIGNESDSFGFKIVVYVSGGENDS